MNSTKTNPSPRSIAFAPSFVYGSALALLFFYSIRSGWIQHPLFTRYVMGHPVSNIETVMLCIGLCALGFKAFALLKERRQLDQWTNPVLDELSESTSTSSDPLVDTGLDNANIVAKTKQNGKNESPEDDSDRAELLLQVIQQRPAKQQRSSVALRFSAALKHIQSRKTAEGIDAQLKHLASEDADAQHESYSLVRLMIWAIPMLGFLGTVIGISEALGGLNLGQDSDISGLITNLKSSLYVAFDTTALALTYGVALMFVQFGLDRVESGLLAQVDRTTEDFVLSTFAQVEEDKDPVARSISRMGQALLKATFGLVEHQHDLWNESLIAAQDAWISATENSKSNSDQYISALIDGASDNLAAKLSNALETADQQLQHRWQQWQVTLSDNTRTLAKFQQNASAHIEMLEQFFETCSHLSHDQQKSITQLMSHLDEMIVQSKQIQ